MIPKDQGGGGTANQKVNQRFPSRVMQNKPVDKMRKAKERTELE
jgi:hypothetical protein